MDNSVLFWSDKNSGFYVNMIFHRLIMGKVEFGHIFASRRYFDFFFHRNVY